MLCSVPVNIDQHKNVMKHFCSVSEHIVQIEFFILIFFIHFWFCDTKGWWQGSTRTLVVRPLKKKFMCVFPYQQKMISFFGKTQNITKVNKLFSCQKTFRNGYNIIILMNTIMGGGRGEARGVNQCNLVSFLKLYYFILKRLKLFVPYFS